MRLAALLAITVLAACTITHEQRGAPIQHDGVQAFESGVTTLSVALDALGPPDEVEQFEDGLRLVYRYRERHERRFRISYRLQLVSIVDGEGSDDVLHLEFDASDRLQRIVENADSEPDD